MIIKPTDSIMETNKNARIYNLAQCPLPLHIINHNSCEKSEKIDPTLKNPVKFDVQSIIQAPRPSTDLYGPPDHTFKPYTRFFIIYIYIGSFVI